MQKMLGLIMAISFFFVTAVFGIAGQGMKQEAQNEEVPGQIQRSTPGGEPSLSPGSGPGTRSDQLTEMEDLTPQDHEASKDDDQSAAEALKELQKKGKISSQSSSQKSH